MLWFFARFFAHYYGTLVSYETVWNFDYSVLSKLFNAFCTWLENKYRHLYRRLPFIKDKLPIFNAKIKAKMLSTHGVIPAECESVALLYDGSRWSTCRPSGPYENQRRVYNRKYKHNAGALAHMGPDAMFYDIWTDTLGAHIDRRFVRDSGCNVILSDMQEGDVHQLHSYGDKGFDTDFDSDTHVKAAYHGPAVVTAAMSDANNKMKTVRVPEEWGGGPEK